MGIPRSTLLLPLVAGCWSARGVSTEVRDTLIDEQVRVEVLSGVAVVAKYAGNGSVQFAKMRTVTDVTSTQLQREHVLVKHSPPRFGPQEKTTSSTQVVEESQGEPREEQIELFTGEITITVSHADTGFYSSETMPVLHGQVRSLTKLPYLPFDEVNGDVSVKLNGVSAFTGLDAETVYASLTEQAFHSVAWNHDDTFRQDWRHWYLPRRQQVRIEAIDLPDLHTDKAPGTRPEPVIQVTLNGQNIGCTAPLGDNMRAGKHVWTGQPSFVADLRAVDTLRYTVLDVDQANHDILRTWTRNGRPHTGNIGWLDVDVQETGTAKAALGACLVGGTLATTFAILPGEPDPQDLAGRAFGRTPLGAAAQTCTAGPGGARLLSTISRAGGGDDPTRALRDQLHRASVLSGPIYQGAFTEHAVTGMVYAALGGVWPATTGGDLQSYATCVGVEYADAVGASAHRR